MRNCADLVHLIGVVSSVPILVIDDASNHYCLFRVAAVLSGKSFTRWYECSNSTARFCVGWQSRSFVESINPKSTNLASLSVQISGMLPAFVHRTFVSISLHSCSVEVIGNSLMHWCLGTLLTMSLLITVIKINNSNYGISLFIKQHYLRHERFNLGSRRSQTIYRSGHIGPMTIRSRDKQVLDV